MFGSKNIRKIVKKYKFLSFFTKSSKHEKEQFYSENDDAEFEKEVFFHFGRDFTIKRMILS